MEAMVGKIDMYCNSIVLLFSNGVGTCIILHSNVSICYVIVCDRDEH